jgi:hypothetical protein
MGRMWALANLRAVRAVPRTLRSGDHQAAVLEHAQVLGHRRPADRQLLGQFPDRARAPSQQLEDRAPARVTEQTQTRISVSVHER